VVGRLHNNVGTCCFQVTWSSAAA